MISKNMVLQNSLKEVIKKHKDVEDILIFGSVVRGKEKFEDIDILVLFKTKIDKNTEYIIRKEFEKHYNKISITSKTIKTAIDPSFDARESILFEGFSLISKDNLAKKYGFVSLGMFKYDFKGWNTLKKTKFYHALNGRKGKKGILHMLNCIKISNNLLLSPLDKIEQTKEFLESWGIEYAYIPIIIPQRLNKKELLQG